MAYDQLKYPSLAALDMKVRQLMARTEFKSWDTGRREFEIARIHPIWWMETFGKIRPGKIEIGVDSAGGSKFVAFKLNPIQLRIADKICFHLVSDKYTRVQKIILKHRKAGVSTLCAAFDYWFMRFYESFNVFVIADLASHSDNIVQMVADFHANDTCGEGASHKMFRPVSKIAMSRNKKGLRYDNNSMLEQDSGENSNPGTSATLNVVHMSENSKWRDPENAETSLLNSIPRTGFAFIVKESTAFGINKYAKDCEDAADKKSSWDLIFVTWLDMPDCEDPVFEGETASTLNLTGEEKVLMTAYPDMRLGHIKFRRRQIELLGNVDKFKQDFPLHAREPFLVGGSNFFNTEKVDKRIKTIKFFRLWKAKGLDEAKREFPELWVSISAHPRGVNTALSLMEDNCVTPQKVIISKGMGGASTYRVDENARLGSGCAEMYRPPDPKKRYLVSIDAAEGKQTTEYTSDNSVIEVFDTLTGEQVLEWAGTFDEEITVYYGVAIAELYNNAVIVPETNNRCGGTLLELLKKSKHKNIYHTEYMQGHKKVKEIGWYTSTAEKKDMCLQFRSEFKNDMVLIHSLEALVEMSNFIDLNGKLGGASGKLDDRVTCICMNRKATAQTPSLKKSLESDTLTTNISEMENVALGGMHSKFDIDGSKKFQSLRRYGYGN